MAQTSTIADLVFIAVSLVPVPTAISLIKGLEIPQSRYSSGVLAVMHSAQYLWITSYYARRESPEESRRNWRPLAYFAVLVAGGIALFVPGPWLASRVFHHDFTASFLISAFGRNCVEKGHRGESF
jgi:hypothetical protein